MTAEQQYSNRGRAVSKISGQFTQRSGEEQSLNLELLQITQRLIPAYGPNWNMHNTVALRRQCLSRILYYAEIYKLIVEIPGVICEFGVQWGATLVQLINLRGMFEPFNHSRKIFGFDTFEGFVDVHEKDGEYSSVGDYATSEHYEEILERLLTIHESFCPIPHMKKFELIKGDASQTIDTWLEDNPHAVIAMAIFDMDVYRPTKEVLQKIKPRLTKGSLLVFDELNCSFFPGETRAVDEVFGLNNLALRRNPHQPFCSWAVFEG